MVDTNANSDGLNVEYADEKMMVAPGDEGMDDVDVVVVMSITIASVGILANLNVIVVFLRERKLKKKIPNIFIVNQVRANAINSFVIGNADFFK